MSEIILNALFHQIKISIRLFFDTLFRKCIIIIQNNKYQEITIAKIDKKNCPAGRSHGLFCNSLIIRYLLNSSVETQPFLGHVSTLHFRKF